MIADNREISDVYTSLGVPVFSELEYNYHSEKGLLLEEGSGKDEIEQILDSHLTEEGTDGLSLKFLSKSDYENAVENIDDWLWDYTENNYGSSYVYSYHYNDVSKTIVIVIRKDTIEG